DYENKSNWKLGENKANQSQYKANQSQYKPNTNPIPEMSKMNENLFATKVYENITTFRLEQNKPNQTQPVVSLSNLFQKDDPIRVNGTLSNGAGRDPSSLRYEGLNINYCELWGGIMSINKDSSLFLETYIH
ncbi:unnamed protein product, partial [marine sediment metagenome]